MKAMKSLKAMKAMNIEQVIDTLEAELSVVVEPKIEQVIDTLEAELLNGQARTKTVRQL